METHERGSPRRYGWETGGPDRGFANRSALNDEFVYRAIYLLLAGRILATIRQH